MPFTEHVKRHTIVLADLRVLFLPVPKAGCTSVLWQLAELAGIPPEAFENSTLPEPSATLTVHDPNAWPPQHRLAEVPAAPGWLRFTVVRDPWRRLWSGWQSKLLLREPRFVDEFGDEPWFPRVPERPADVVEDFRAFVASLPGGIRDVHWCVQRDLVAQLPLDHVGRAEDMAATMAILRAHVGEVAAPRQENATPLPLPPGAFDEESAAIVRAVYREDLDAFGYGDEPPDGDRDWERTAELLLPTVRAAIDTHARVGQLHALSQRRAQRARAGERRTERRHEPARTPVIANLEEEDDYTVRWGWAEGPVAPGFTAVVRVKDEARSLPWSLPPLLRAAERVVLVDNGSTDGTPRVAREIAAAEDAAGRLDVRTYPFPVARCGPEHLGTPASSVRSLAHFYNWSFSHVRTGYALKWDGDMVLTDAAVAALRDLAWQLETAETVVRVPRLPLYVADGSRAFLDAKLRNNEPWAWPNKPGYRFVKALEWELPMFPPGVATMTLPDWGCVELKFLDADEFAHWSQTDFTASPRQSRKRREQEVFAALASGGAPPDGVIAIEAPDVIEHVRTRWLPAAAAGRAAVAA